jgi:hypothetical protein
LEFSIKYKNSESLIFKYRCLTTSEEIVPILKTFIKLEVIYAKYKLYIDEHIYKFSNVAGYIKLLTTEGIQGSTAETGFYYMKRVLLRIAQISKILNKATMPFNLDRLSKIDLLYPPETRPKGLAFCYRIGQGDVTYFIK